MFKRLGVGAHLGLAAVAVAVCLAAYVVWHHEAHQRPAATTAIPAAATAPNTAAPPVSPSPGLEFDTLRLTGSHRGKKEWELSAKRVATDDTTKMAVVEGLEKVAIYRDGKLYFQGSADKGTYNIQTKDIEVSGTIRLRDESGNTFETQEALWSAATEVLTIPGKVNMVLDGRRVAADHAVADVKAERVTAEGSVRVEGSGETLTGKRLIFNVKDSSIAIEGQSDIELVM